MWFEMNYWQVEEEEEEVEEERDIPLVYYERDTDC